MQLTPIARPPLLLRLPTFIFRPTQVLDTQARQHGDFYAVGTENLFVYISNPQALQKIFAADPAIFKTSQTSNFFTTLFGSSSTLLLDGIAHRQRRKLLMPAFHGDRVQTYSQIISQITRQVTAPWQAGTTVRLRPVMQAITLETIGRVAFGSLGGERSRQLQQLLGRMLDGVSSPLVSIVLFFPSLQQDWGSWSPWGRFLRLKQAIDRLLFEEIEARQAQPHPGDDLISLLMAARDEAGNPLSPQEIRDELITLLVAGHETTASALCWALYWIHSQPEVERQLRQELTNVAPEAAGTRPYLGAVCSETLRLYPIAPNGFLRQLKTDWDLLGYTLKAGTFLLPCIYQVHHREDLYPDPKRFRPERFLERQFAPYEFLPFGGGNRRCVGMALALQELKVVLATLLSQFQGRLVSSRPEKPVRRGLTLAPSPGMRLRILARHQPGSPRS